MIRGYCTVCQDNISHVTGQEDQEVSTGPCGHVFHYDCLKTWLRQKMSCPKCRHKVTKPIILYVDEDETGLNASTEGDPNALRVKLEHLKGLIKKKDEENTNLVSEKIQAQDLLDDVKSRCSFAEKKLSSERSVNAALKKQMAFLKKQELEVDVAKREAITCKQELQRFTRLKTLVEGSKDDVETMLHDIRSDGSATSEMITQLMILKKELEKIKDSRNKARQAKETYEREISKLKHELSSKEVDYNKVSEQLNLTESDLMRSEKEIASLKKKISKLELAFNSPSPRSSAIIRLMKESPAPMELKGSLLTCPEDDSENDIFKQESSSSSQHHRASNDNDMEFAAKWMGLPLVKTTTLHTGQPKPFKPLTRPPLHTIRARKRPADNEAESAVIRKGYDGLGGHAKFLKPSKPRQGPIRKVARPNTISKFIKTTKDGKEPPLPVLNLDFDS